MSYYFNKTIKGKNFEEAIAYVTDELKKEGFGIVTSINMKETLKNKIGVDFKNYHILGTCNPGYAHKALLSEDKIGVFLPCNVIVEQHENGNIEVAAVDPVASMISVKNDSLGGVATEVQAKLKKVIEGLQ